MKRKQTRDSMILDQSACCLTISLNVAVNLLVQAGSVVLFHDDDKCRNFNKAKTAIIL